MDEPDIQDQFNVALDRNLRERKRLSKTNVERMFSRKSMEQGFLECFELIGGVPRLAIWANDPANYGDFLKLLIKFAPKEASEQAGQILNYVSNVPQSALNHVGVEKIEGDFKEGEHADPQQ